MVMKITPQIVDLLSVNHFPRSEMMLTKTTETHPDDAKEDRELSRLLTAAVINPEFRWLLLNASRTALQRGYNGEFFNLSPDSQALILSIQAASLEEFASQLVSHRRNGNGSNARSKKELSSIFINPAVRIG
jgi:hypothetical protein